MLEGPEDGDDLVTAFGVEADIGDTRAIKPELGIEGASHGLVPRRMPGSGPTIGCIQSILSPTTPIFEKQFDEKPRNRSSKDVFRRPLAIHLLARYAVPTFMTSVWLRDRDAEALRYQVWYKHIGLGRNIRTADLPLPYTKRMAHEFVQAPDHLTVEAALRWGQVRGMGGSEELARAVAATRLGRFFQHEDFWKTVIQFFVNEPTLDLVHIGPIVDYLNVQKFVPQEDSIEEGELGQPGPPQPNLTMKGRTKRSLLRLVEEWHKSLRHRPDVIPIHWERSNISGLHFIELDGRDQESPRIWTIHELLTSGELYREGLAMEHCVGSYVRACAGRASSIWSMRIENQVRRHRVMTIEVDMKRRMICQARRRRNARPNGKAREILERWARRERLTIAGYL